MGEPMVTVEFRDGEKLVPHHVAILMKGIETHTLTFTQALQLANQALVRERLRAAQQGLINSHFRANR